MLPRLTVALTFDFDAISPWAHEMAGNNVADLSRGEFGAFALPRIDCIVSTRSNCRRGRGNFHLSNRVCSWNSDQHGAAGTRNVLAGMRGVALDVLITMRAGEFEFAHKPEVDSLSCQSTSHSLRILR